MHSNKGHTGNKTSTLKAAWSQGPIGDKSLTPGHGRPVPFYPFSTKLK